MFKTAFSGKFQTVRPVDREARGNAVYPAASDGPRYYRAGFHKLVQSGPLYFLADGSIVDNDDLAMLIGD